MRVRHKFDNGGKPELGEDDTPSDFCGAAGQALRPSLRLCDAQAAAYMDDSSRVSSSGASATRQATHGFPRPQHTSPPPHLLSY